MRDESVRRVYTPGRAATRLGPFQTASHIGIVRAWAPGVGTALVAVDARDALGQAGEDFRGHGAQSAGGLGGGQVGPGGRGARGSCLRGREGVGKRGVPRERAGSVGRIEALPLVPMSIT